MKKLLGVLAIVILAARLPAQSNEPVRLALISESDEASVASDVLTAQLSGNEKLHLLERNEIERVYREQRLAGANRDDLKLGRILGADGLLLFDVVRTPQATNLTARLIAVKPGVVLTDGSFHWPLKDTTSWAESIATYLNSFLPKLALLPKDAIPISVVNLRSAVQSAEAQETERQLKLLTIQRLSQERQFFVLERQRMQLLGEEKELTSDESAFWDGSYLLEGVVDQNGYSKDTITIDARLTPPKGGTTLEFEVSGSRTNLAEVINQLAAKVNEALKVSSIVKEWNAADEAAQYFDEAKWALRWGVFPEAQAAADSAWALGKKDLDCALVRVKSYVLEVSANVGGYGNLEESYGAEGGYNANGAPIGNPPSEARIQSDIKKMLTQHRWGIIYKETQDEAQKAKRVQYVFANGPPDSRNIDRALHASELYYDFSRTSPDGEPKILSRGKGWNDWHNSDWYQLGIEELVATSQALQDFNLAPLELQKPVADKLAELRALARSVAELISESPSVHDSYFVGNRVAVYDELAYTIGEEGGRNPNIFSCEVKWGCFWQERPEDCIALYRELMSSPVFCYIHNKFWFRELPSPRLIAWNEEDQKRIPTVWNGFVQELNASTNALLRLEGKAIQLAEADSEVQMGAAFTNFFSAIFENHDALVANNVDVLYLGWGAGDLVEKMGGETTSHVKESLRHLYYSEYSPKLDAMDREYRSKTVPAIQFLSTFEQQKQYLKENKPYDFFEFVDMFRERNYSRTQALEIQPLLAAYKSNLVAQSQTASGTQKGKLRGAIAQVGFVEMDVNRTLNPPAPRPQQKIEIPQPSIVAKTLAPASITTNEPEVVTNVIVVNRFSPIPVDSLVQLDSSERIDSVYSGITVNAHHWLEGRLLVEFEYVLYTDWLDEKGNVKGGRHGSSGSAIAIFDPSTEHWDVIDCPAADLATRNNFYHRTALLQGDLFTCDGGQIREYDFKSRQWNVLGISDGNNYELFALNGHLYAANRNMIFEILDGGKSTRIMASNRRQPPASALDREDLGTPTLFAGPGYSLRVSTKNKIFTWAGNDWREDSGSPPPSVRPEVFTDGILFRQMSGRYNQPPSLSFLGTETNAIELYVGQNPGQIMPPPNHRVFPGFDQPDANTTPSPEPLWKLPPGLSLANLPAAVWQSDLYLLVDHSEARDIVDERQHLIIGREILPKDGYHAALLCYSRGQSLPQKLFLKFEASDGNPPLTGNKNGSPQMSPMAPSGWMLFTTNFLIFGLETPNNIVPGGGSGVKAGVWVMPISRLETARAAQKEVILDQKAREMAETEQFQEDFLAKYDRNHNGVLDPEEKERAMDDPGYTRFMVNMLRAEKARANSRLSPTNEP